jgi:predicted RNA binding protein YcfA (HicA-like mRNA interferase family)
VSSSDSVFVSVRQKGSHAIFRHPNGRRVTIPIHGSKEPGPAPFKQILKDLNISIGDFWNSV